jgi:hypothetical protein
MYFAGEKAIHSSLKTMIVTLFIALFLLVGVGAFIRSGFERRNFAPRQQYAYKGQSSRYIPEADNL